ncbi:MAG: NAD-dependent malic enzyme [Gammaproteobacteria bacterium RIFCSPLOWO2_02_FULL_56_15]|nr:MAG: NAD-dependent malic enzyme [Gammaproteobacteria bacterium RIFCSPLOWO2_02_FULL_56_15]
MDVLHDPLLNRGLGFSLKERSKLGLRGLLPPRVQTQTEQLNRRLAYLRSLSSDLEKYIDLNALHDRNEALFFRMIIDHPDEIMPLIYTPTVGLACQKFGSIFQRPRGLFISSSDKGRIAGALRNWPRRDVGIIVVTDGERILGLGDLGANGMGIPVGKLALYTACAGITPERCLPVMLDVGTDNEDLLNDPFYIGLRQKRLRGKAYDVLIEEFFREAQKVFPGALIQFEDFGNTNAFRLLRHYRDRICTFNDDIQGTAAVALAGIYSALRITGGKLPTQRILCLGAGEAATGICDLVASAMMEEGLTEAEAQHCCWLFDSHGLVVSSRRDLAEHKLPYAHDYEEMTDFNAAIRSLKPTAIIGVAAARGRFSRQVLKTMASLNEHPIVFALSNPTSVAECSAEQAYRHTAGRAVFAGGSPFNPVSIDGRSLVPRQGNNAYIFPGVGLGILASGAKRVTDEMFLAAARALSLQVKQEDLDQGSIYPPLSNIREVSAHIATAVAEVAFASRLASKRKPRNLLAHVKSQMYDPHY